MPNPQPEDTRSANGETRRWDGGGWVLLGGSAFPKGTIEPWNAEDAANTSNAFKTFMGLGGSFAGSLLGPAGTIAGGAVGRAIGHIPEALLSRRTGTPNDSSFAREAARGAMEGATAEMAPAVTGPVLKFGGKMLQVVGDSVDRLGSTTTNNPLTRGLALHYLGAPSPVAIAGAVAPPLLRGTGSLAEQAGEAIGGRRLSTMTRPMRSLFGVADEPVELSATTRAAAGTRRSVDVPYRAGSGVSDGFTQEGPRAPMTTPPSGWEGTTPVAGVEGGTMKMPTPAEPIYGDIRDQLQGVARRGQDPSVVRDLIAKGYDPTTGRRLMSSSDSPPSMKSLMMSDGEIRAAIERLRNPRWVAKPDALAAIRERNSGR